MEELKTIGIGEKVYQFQDDEARSLATQHSSNLQIHVTAQEKAEWSGNATDIATIKSKIPNQASSTNQLADKNYVDYGISTNTATFIGTYNNMNDLILAGRSKGADKNDYAFIRDTDDFGNNIYKRYKFVSTDTWEWEYTLNNVGFNTSQWDAVNSGITAEKIRELEDLSKGCLCISIQNNVLEENAYTKIQEAMALDVHVILVDKYNPLNEVNAADQRTMIIAPLYKREPVDSGADDKYFFRTIVDISDGDQVYSYIITKPTSGGAGYTRTITTHYYEDWTFTLEDDTEVTKTVVTTQSSLSNFYTTPTVAQYSIRFVDANSNDIEKPKTSTAKIGQIVQCSAPEYLETPIGYYKRTSPEFQDLTISVDSSKNEALFYYEEAVKNDE